jgi:hypothetical protein
MTNTELQSQIQRKAQELPPDLLQEVFDYMEFILEKRKKRPYSQDHTIENWWRNMSNFSNDFMTQRVQPPLDKTENLFE